jgi:hypothetical protein
MTMLQNTSSSGDEMHRVLDLNAVAIASILRNDHLQGSDRLRQALTALQCVVFGDMAFNASEEQQQLAYWSRHVASQTASSAAEPSGSPADIDTPRQYVHYVVARVANADIRLDINDTELYFRPFRIVETTNTTRNEGIAIDTLEAGAAILFNMAIIHHRNAILSTTNQSQMFFQTINIYEQAYQHLQLLTLVAPQKVHFQFTEMKAAICYNTLQLSSAIFYEQRATTLHIDLLEMSLLWMERIYLFTPRSANNGVVRTDRRDDYWLSQEEDEGEKEATLRFFCSRLAFAKLICCHNSPAA